MAFKKLESEGSKAFRLLYMIPALRLSILCIYYLIGRGLHGPRLQIYCRAAKVNQAKEGLKVIHSKYYRHLKEDTNHRYCSRKRRCVVFWQIRELSQITFVYMGGQVVRMIQILMQKGTSVVKEIPKCAKLTPLVQECV